MDTNTQEDDFDLLCDELRFKIYSDNPSLSIVPFLKDNFPYLVTRPEQGGWTVYPPGPVEIPKMSIRSLQLDQHPFVRITHNSVRMDFLTQEWTKGPAGISQTRVWIDFANRLQAEAAQRHLAEEFQNIGAYVRRSISDNETKITLYKDSDMEEWNSVSILLKEHPEKNGYSLVVLFSGDNESSWKLDSA